MINKPQLSSATFTFSQEGNTSGTTEEYEELIIEADSSLGIDADGDAFYVFKTEGWSIDEVDELKELTDRIALILPKKVKK